MGCMKLLHVHAHPDDESSKGAATTAYYVAQGVEVLVATCTGGERGSILNPKMESPENWANLAELRRAEMAKAAQILGIQQVWLGYVDSGLPEGDEELPPEAFARIDPEVAAVMVKDESKPKLSKEEIQTRFLEAMADEARRILDDGVVAEPQDIDTGLIFGAGYPFFMGGLTRYLDQKGISEKVNGKKFLTDDEITAYLER